MSWNNFDFSRRTCLLLGALLSLASSVSAQASGRRSASVAHVRIETDRSSYKVGDDIKVRLTLHNTSTQSIRFAYSPPADQVKLRVADTHNRELKPTTPISPQVTAGSTFYVELKAGAEQVLSWKTGEWISIEDWGFHIRTPGNYSIRGIPMLEGSRLTPDTKTVRSNQATFTIEE